jgi:hypothetical protein
MIDIETRYRITHCREHQFKVAATQRAWCAIMQDATLESDTRRNHIEIHQIQKFMVQVFDFLLRYCTNC